MSGSSLSRDNLVVKALARAPSLLCEHTLLLSTAITGITTPSISSLSKMVKVSSTPPSKPNRVACLLPLSPRPRTPEDGDTTQTISMTRTASLACDEPDVELGTSIRRERSVLVSVLQLWTLAGKFTSRTIRSGCRLHYEGYLRFVRDRMNHVRSTELDLLVSKALVVKKYLVA